MLYQSELCVTFRFINDLTIINNENFEGNIQNIYLFQLELEKEKQIDKNVNFLNLNIQIQNFRFETKLYNKRDNFNFDIIKMSYKSSNIPQKMVYSVM